MGCGSSHSAQSLRARPTGLPFDSSTGRSLSIRTRNGRGDVGAVGIIGDPAEPLGLALGAEHAVGEVQPLEPGVGRRVDLDLRLPDERPVAEAGCAERRSGHAPASPCRAAAAGRRCRPRPASPPPRRAAAPPPAARPGSGGSGCASAPASRGDTGGRPAARPRRGTETAGSRPGAPPGGPGLSMRPHGG